VPAGGTTASGGTTAAGGTSGKASAGGVNKARPFSASSPFNTPTPDTIVWKDNHFLHTCEGADCSGDPRRYWWPVMTFGVVWSRSTDPLWTFDLPELDATAWHRVHPATKLQMRAPETLQVPYDDGVVLVADEITGDYIELYGATITRATHTVVPADNTSWATGNMITGTGTGDKATNLNGGVRATNFSWAAGSITKADIDSGKIDHALALALPALCSIPILRGGAVDVDPGPYCAPATCGNGSMGSTAADTITMGAKIGIPKGSKRPDGLSRIGNMVFDAMVTYGAYVGDGAGGASIIFAVDGLSFGMKDISKEIPYEQIPAELKALYASWDMPGGKADFDLMEPLLRVSDCM
jgi:hypothetical protein